MFLQISAEEYNSELKCLRYKNMRIPVDHVAAIAQDKDGKTCFITIKTEHRQKLGLRVCGQFGEAETGFGAAGSLADIRTENPEIFASSALFFSFHCLDYGKSLGFRETLFSSDTIEEVCEEEGGQICFIAIKEQDRHSHGLSDFYSAEGYRAMNSLATLRAMNPHYCFSERPSLTVLDPTCTDQPHPA